MIILFFQQHSRKTKGLTLVELLVSVALGLVIMASLSTVLFDTAQLTKVGISEVKTLRQFERTMDVLETTIQLAGFMPELVDKGETTKDRYKKNDVFIESQLAFIKSYGENKSTELYLRTFGYKDSSVDCLGRIIPHDVQATMTIRHDDSNNTLVCEVEIAGITDSAVLMNNVVFLAFGSIGTTLFDKRVSKMAYFDTPPTSYNLRGIIFELVIESEVDFYSKNTEQSIHLFLDNAVSFSSKKKIAKASRTIALLNKEIKSDE